MSNNKLFDRNWQVYHQIFEHNYMRHREIAAVINEFFDTYFHQPINVLDLGCGDADFSALVLANTQIIAYQGVDLSIEALTLAGNNFKDIEGEKHFIQGDILDFLPKLAPAYERKFDLILSSFAFHHFTSKQKEYLLGLIPPLLTEDGVFILVDIILKPGENRRDYLNRYISHVRNHWQLLTSEDQLTIEEHIISSDFPETQETWQILAHHHHLRCQSLYINPLYTEQILAFTRRK